MLRPLGLVCLAVGVLTSSPSPAGIYSFAGSSAGTAFSLTAADGIVATFTSPDGAFSATDPSVFSFGPALLAFPSAELDVSFSAVVGRVRFAFATADIAGLSDPTTVTATFLNGTTKVATITATGIFSGVSGFPEGVISFDGPTTGFTLTDTASAGLAIGQIDVPAPGGLLTVLPALGGWLLMKRRDRGARA